METNEVGSVSHCSALLCFVFAGIFFSFLCMNILISISIKEIVWYYLFSLLKTYTSSTIQCMLQKKRSVKKNFVVCSDCTSEYIIIVSKIYFHNSFYHTLCLCYFCTPFTIYSLMSTPNSSDNSYLLPKLLPEAYYNFFHLLGQLGPCVL